MMDITRRTVLAGSGSLGLGTMAARTLAVSPSGPASLQVRDPATSQRTNPVGLDEPRPTLSWRIEGPDGTMQAAYRVRVATSLDRLRTGKADLWDSGRIDSGEASGIAFGGPAPGSGQECHWQVEAWDQNGNRARSEPACWTMGLLDQADWRGDWLAVEDASERDDRRADPRWVTGSAPTTQSRRRFRLRFTSGTGPAVVTLASFGVLHSVSLDGAALDLPFRDPNAFGGAPAPRWEIALEAGHHVLEAVVSSTPGFFTKSWVNLAGLVRLTGTDGETLRVTQGWETALDEAEAWRPAAQAEQQANFPWPPTPARLLRRSFARRDRPARALLHIAALGGWQAWLNGARVGLDEMQSEPVNYAARIPSRSYDVTHTLRSGENVLGLLVGDGHFASYQSPDGRYAYLPAPRRVKAVLQLIETDGTSSFLATDGAWRHARSHVTMSEIYNGEDQDLSLWPEGWMRPGFDASDWDRAWSAPDPRVPIRAALAEPVQIQRTRAPESLRRLGPNRFLADFGQNFAGRVRLELKGPRASLVEVRTGEVLDETGQLDQANLRAARASDRYRLSGHPRGETLCPALTYQGFRYAEIRGPETLSAEQVTGELLTSSLRETGTFRIDEPVIQKLWLNTLWSQRSNFMGIPTDCPQRDERLGWTGDAQVFWDTASFTMATGAFTRDFCRTLRDQQAPNGAYPLWAPNPTGLGWETTSGTPGWSDAGVMLPYVSYLHDGDRTVVDENWQAMTSYLKGILATNADGLWRHDRGIDLGDWLALDAKSPMDETTPKQLIGTAMLARSIEQMAQMAQWSGRANEAEAWRAQFTKTRSAFQRAYVHRDGTIGNASQTSYILAIALGLLDAVQQRQAGTLLAADIRRRGTLLSTGFLGTPLALDALAAVGEDALVWDLLTRRAYPSWGYMVEHGATTIWERWNGDAGDVTMNSFNHYALGAVCGFLYRRVGGITPTEPGFARFRVDILGDPRIGSGGTTLDTVRGRIETRWQRREGGMALDLTVPANTLAEVVTAQGLRNCGPGTYQLTLA